MHIRVLVLLSISLFFGSYGLAGDLQPRKHPAKVAASIDSDVDAALSESKIPASPPADDAEFLRRVYLDLTGTIPTVKQAVAFLDQEDSGKRAALIDQLLASPLYGRHFGARWQPGVAPGAVANAGRRVCCCGSRRKARAPLHLQQQRLSTQQSTSVGER